MELPSFYIQYKGEKPKYLNLICLKGGINDDSQKNVISLYDFLIFLTYIPATSVMSDFTQKSSKDFKTFSIYSESTQEKLLFKIKLFQDGSASIKSFVINFACGEEVYVDGATRMFLRPSLKIDKIKDLLQVKKENFYEYFTKKHNNVLHPFIRVCKYIKTKSIAVTLNDFIIKHAYSKNSIYKFQHPESKDEDKLTKDFFLKHEGDFMIKLTKNKAFPMKYEEEKFIHSLVWIEKHSLSVLKRTNFIELDCSFYVFKPYVYCIPQAIICNEAIPLGISIGPSEANYIYKQFYDFLEKTDVEAFGIIKDLPILSDEGKALIKFAGDFNLKHFFCFRHIIQKFGADTSIAALTRSLLYSQTLEEFKKIIELSSSNIDKIFKESNISQLKKFAKLFGYESFPMLREAISNKCPSSTRKNIEEYGENPLFFSQSLWERARFRVSTCSNHAESMHGKLNKKVRNINSKEFHDRFELIFESIEERIITSTKRRNLKEAIQRIKKVAKNYETLTRREFENPSEQKESKLQNFYSILYDCDFPSIKDVWTFTITPFESFAASDRESIFIEEEEDALATVWSFKDVSHFNIPELDEISHLLIKIYGIPRRSFFDNIINLLYRPDEDKDKIKMYVRFWFVHWCRSIYGALFLDEEHIQKFNSFIFKYSDDNTRTEALQELKIQIDIYKNERDNNIAYLEHEHWATSTDETIVNPAKMPTIEESNMLSIESSIPKIQQDKFTCYTKVEKNAAINLDFKALISYDENDVRREIYRFIEENNKKNINVLIDAILYAMEIVPDKFYMTYLIHIASHFNDGEYLITSRFPSLSLRVRSVIYNNGIGKNIGYIPTTKSASVSEALLILRDECLWNFYNIPDLMCAAAFEGLYDDLLKLSIRCTSFKKEVCYFAVAGGNFRIVEYLFKRECSFDYTFHIAVYYHRNNLFEYLLNIGKQRAVDEKKCNAVYNKEAILFIRENRERFVE